MLLLEEQPPAVSGSPEPSLPEPVEPVEPVEPAATLAGPGGETRLFTAGEITAAGVALYQAGKFQEAAENFELVCRLCPGSSDACSNLGAAYGALDRFEDALAQLRRAVELDPDNAEALTTLGNLLADNDRVPEGLDYCRKAVKIKPDLLVGLMNLANCLFETENFTEAGKHYQQALDLEPDSPAARCGLAAVLTHQQDSAGAMKLYDEASAARPGLARAHCGRGKLLSDLGRMDESRQALRRSIDADKTLVAAYAQLAEQLRGGVSDSDVTDMLELFGTCKLNKAQQATLHFGLGYVFDGRDDWQRAARHWALANHLRRAHKAGLGLAYDLEAFEILVGELIRMFTPEFFQRVSSWGVASSRPVFVVGMPRGGTTLVEQILSGHSRVHAAGELPLVPRCFDELITAMENDSDKLRPEHVRRIAGNYLSALDKLDSTHRHVVDKLPDNYLHLGLIATLLPGARIIHCDRDYRDTAVSCWSTDFGSIRWAGDKDDLAHRFRQHERIMSHWRDVLPLRIFHCRYEDMVGDTERTVRGLLDFLDLPWETNWREFHAASRTVRTASSSQVRQPIYRRSLERWRKYQPYLRDLFDRLPVKQEEASCPA